MINNRIANMYKQFVWEPELVRINVISAATEAANGFRKLFASFVMSWETLLVKLTVFISFHNFKPLLRRSRLFLKFLLSSSYFFCFFGSFCINLSLSLFQ